MKEQDIYQPISRLRLHDTGIRALWQWMQDNWTTLVEKLPPSLSLLGSVVIICTSGFTKVEHMDEINRFFKDKDTKGFDQSLARALDSIKAKASWVDRDRGDVQGWLKENGYLSGSQDKSEL